MGGLARIRGIGEYQNHLRLAIHGHGRELIYSFMPRMLAHTIDLVVGGDFS